MKKYILIDTDIGDDIDDAFALSLALKSKELQVVGITTVFRNTHCRAQQVEKLLAEVGEKIPVYEGMAMPLQGVIPRFGHDSQCSTAQLLQTAPCQYDDSMAVFVPQRDAVEAIGAFVKQYDGELIVVTLGAMTNLAQAIRNDPDIVTGISKVVCMGGWFTNFQPEWNILCDPTAAQIVLESGVDVYAVGLDVTLQCTVDKDLLDDFRTSTDPSNRLLMQWIDRWFDAFHFEKSVMHDPLAVASVYTDVCEFEWLYARVITQGDACGAIEVKEVPEEGFYPIHVAKRVDKDQFYRLVRSKMLNMK